MRVATACAVTAIALALGACASVYNQPLNAPSATPFTGTVGAAAAIAAAEQRQVVGSDDTVIGLAFSGGGTRAAAFAYGVLDRLAQTPASKRDPQARLIDDVGVVSGVSGGSIMAAYFGLKGKAALTDFRDQFLTQDVMASLDTSFTLVNVSRALGGGANTDNKLRDWFNAHLYHHATFGDLAARRRPVVVINATDIYSRTPFLFAPQAFAAACSDFGKYPIAAAVAASAAVPGAFAPVVIETFPGECNTPLPPWVDKAANDPAASPLLHAYAKGLKDIRDGKVKYVKLFDGGLIDNYGLSGITIVRAAQTTPYGPLRPEEAINLRRLMFLVVDAGQGPQGNWSTTLEGPAGKDLVAAVVDVLVDANAHASYAAFEATMKNWRDAIVRWRCGLKPAEVAKLRGRAGPWNCRDLNITVGRISFDQLDAARARALNQVPTSFTLPADTVDEVARAGGDALAANPAFQAFVKGM
ncbi:MAG TPA: patatin-like phospholipase family protein [Pseudolabrys sp.]|nr:patatin-like phospholipase family protein [Pseudolabrys sp.]